MKILMYSAKEYDKQYFTKEKTENIKISYIDCLLSNDTVKLAHGYDAICIFVNDNCDSYILNELYNYGVKAVLLRCAGYNNVDTDFAKEKGIVVARVPDYSPSSVAEYAVALILCLNRKIHKAYNRVRENNFALNGLVGNNLYGKTVGVIGYGKVGEAFAKIMAGFSCDVIVYDPFLEAGHDTFKKVSLTEIFKKSDIISLHCPLTESSKHIINDKSLSQVKPRSLIINTSRGGLIDTKSIIAALKYKKISGLAMDVYEEESQLFFNDRSEDIIEDEVFERLLTFPNVLITGHQSYLTDEALTSIAKATLQNAKNIDNNTPCDNVV